MQWFRFYSEALDDPKVQRLPGDLFKAWVNLLCLANEQEERGTLPPLDDIAFRLRLDHQKAEDALTGLRRGGLLEHNADTDEYRIHAWDKRQYASDLSTDRVRKFREKQRETANETERNKSETFQKRSRNAIDTDTEQIQIQNRVEQTPPLPPTPSQPKASPPDGGGRVRAAPKPSLLNAEARTAFEEWYRRYPNKQHRPEAERAWSKLKPDHDLLTRLLGDIETRKLGRKWAEGYIEHPATYLNNRVWEDDIEPVRMNPPVRATHTGFSSDDAFAKNMARLKAVGRQ